MRVKTRRLFCRILILLIVLTLCFIWGNSLQSRETSGDISNSLLEIVNGLLGCIGLELKDDHLLRKFAHFFEFAVLGAELYLLALLRQVKQTQSLIYLVALGACLSVAITDETIQYFVGRACRGTDVMLDFCGSLFGVLLLRFLINVFPKLKNKLNYN